METGAIVGIVGGVIGGLVGTYFSVRNTRGPREKRLMLAAAVLTWALLAGSAAGAYLFPQIRNWVAFGLVLLVIIGTPWLNRVQTRVRLEESTRH